VPSAGLGAWLAGPARDPGANARRTLRQLRRERCVMVVPAFECRPQPGGGYPADVAAVRALAEAGEARGFHTDYFPQGHAPTDFGQWFARSAAPSTLPSRPGGAPATAPRAPTPRGGSYAVPFAAGFEPYVLAAREALPLYDERFRGYGMNKISHLHAVHAAGLCFRVLEGHFACAFEHGRSAEWQRTFGRPETRVPMRKVSGGVQARGCGGCWRHVVCRCKRKRRQEHGA
jgi:hypothetical protein